MEFYCVALLVAAVLALLYSVNDIAKQNGADVATRAKLIIRAFSALAVLGGVGLAVGTLKLNQTGQVADRFSKAVDQIGAVTISGAPNVEVRLGGIYALAALANDEQNYRRQVLEILTAYVRQNAPYSFERAVERADGDAQRRAASFIGPVIHRRPVGCFDIPTSPVGEHPRVDVQAAVAAVALRSWEVEPPVVIDLSRTDLHGVRLDGARLAGADLGMSRLDRASLIGADLRNAFIARSSFALADMVDANLGQDRRFNANMLQTDFSGAKMWRANLTRADLDSCLRGTFLNDANLTDAIVSGDLDGAYLFCAHLKGADFTSGQLLFRLPFELEDLRHRISSSDGKGAILPAELNPDTPKAIPWTTWTGEAQCGEAYSLIGPTR
jgi:uncharacterized protein YjbI with pentapeptide repeats